MYEKKINKLTEKMMELYPYEENYIEADKLFWEWSYLLDDLYYNSERTINSQYRPDPSML